MPRGGSGTELRIFVPEISSPVKIDAIRAEGAEVVVGGARYADAQAACDQYASATGALLIHPFDAPETIDATGTVALEWDADIGALPPLDTVLVASGGGGASSPGLPPSGAGRVKVIAVEPEGSRCLHAALEAGRPVDVTVESIAADSLGAKRAGDLVFAIAKEKVARVVLVPDAAMSRAQRALLWAEYRISTRSLAAPQRLAGSGLRVGTARPQGERVGDPRLRRKRRPEDAGASAGPLRLHTTVALPARARHCARG